MPTRREILRDTLFVGAMTGLPYLSIRFAFETYGGIDRSINVPEYGTFQSIYETSHTIGTPPDKIPSDLNVLFKEQPVSQDLNTAQFLTKRHLTGKVYNDGVLEKLAKNKIKLIAGDIEIPPLPDFEQFWGVLVEFRNMLFAEKMFAVADYFNRDSTRNIVRKVKVGFNLGSGHNGVEGFLTKGPDETLAAILEYPTSFLKEVIKGNSGIENFCSTRLIELPEDFQMSDLQSSEKQRAIRDRRITDVALLNGLRKIV